MSLKGAWSLWRRRNLSLTGRGPGLLTGISEYSRARRSRRGILGIAVVDRILVRPPQRTAPSRPGYGFRQAIVGLVAHFQRFEFEQFGLRLILRGLCLVDLTQELCNGALEIVTPD
jgi:hypothetical protein